MTDDLEDAVALGRGRRGKSRVRLLEDICFAEAHEGQNSAAVLVPRP